MWASRSQIALPNRTAVKCETVDAFHEENRDSDDEVEEAIERDAEKRAAEAKAMAKAMALQRRKDQEAARLEKQRQATLEEEGQREKKKRTAPKERAPPKERVKTSSKGPRAKPATYSGPEITDPKLLECAGRGSKFIRGGSRAAAIYRGMAMDGWTLFYCISAKRYEG